MTIETTSPNTDAAEQPVTYSLLVTLFPVDNTDPRTDTSDAVRLIEQLDGVIAELEAEHVELRGCFDLTGFEAVTGPSVLMVWLRSSSVTNLQWALRQLKRTELLRELVVFEERVVVELTELDPQPGRWMQFLSASEALDPEFSDDDLDVLEQTEVFVDDAEQAELDAADPELDSGAAADAIELRGDAMVSLHAVLGLGELEYVVIAEAETPVALLGPLGQPFGDDLELVIDGNLAMGRYVTTAELFEVLR